MGKKRGRRPNKYVAYGCQVIEGLSYDKHPQQRRFYYYYTDKNGRRKKKTLGTDIGEAVRTYLLSSEAKKRVKFCIDDLEAAEKGGDVSLQDGVFLLVRKSNWEALTLQQAGDWYFNREVYKSVQPLSRKTKEDSMKWWEEFFEFISPIERVKDITESNIRDYQEHVYKTARNHGFSTTWRKHRLDTVKTVLRNSRSMLEYCDGIDKVLGYCSKFKRLDKEPGAHIPISRRDFHKILSACDVKMTAILLLSLNCGLTCKDVHDVLESEVDLKKRTFIKNTPHTSILRVAVLWERTILALKQYGATQPHKSRHLFLSRRGDPYDPQALRSRWRGLLIQAHVDKNVKFLRISHGSEKAAKDAGCKPADIRLLLGRKLPDVAAGDLKQLVYRTQDVCKAIEQCYFPEDMPQCPANYS